MRPVLILDTDVPFALNLKQLFRKFDTQAQSFESADQYFSSRACKKPHVALVETSLKLESGLDVIRIAAADPEIAQVYAMSNEPTVDMAVQVIKAGAQDFLLKPFSIQPIVQAAHRPQHNPLTNGVLVDALSSRQQQVAQLLLSETPIKDIAANLQISTRTVEVHRRKIFKTLGVKSRIELINRFK